MRPRPSPAERRHVRGRPPCKLHVGVCEAWGRQARLADATWEGPLLTQVAGIQLDDATIAAVVAALGSAERPVALDWARIDRRFRELALEHAGGAIGEDAYLARRRAADAVGRRCRGVRTGRIGGPGLALLRVLGESVQSADVPAAKADLLHAIYERVIVAGREIRAVRLTTAAYAHGLALSVARRG